MRGEVHFGLVLPRPDAAAGLSSRDLEQFRCLKVSSDCLLEQGTAERLRLVFPGCGILAGDLADRSLCELAPEERINLRLCFIGQFQERCRRMKSAGVGAGSASFDLTRAAWDSVYRARFLTLLRCCCSILHEEKFLLYLPWRVPSPPGGVSAGACGELLRELPLENLRILAQWHPHEPAFAALPHDFMNPIRFETRGVEISYEPSIGNRLTSRLIGDCLRRMILPGSVLRVYFNAAGLTGESWERAVADLAELVLRMREEYKELEE